MLYGVVVTVPPVTAGGDPQSTAETREESRQYEQFLHLEQRMYTLVYYINLVLYIVFIYIETIQENQHN